MKTIKITKPPTFDFLVPLLAKDEPNTIICKLEHFKILKEICISIQQTREEQGINIYKERPCYITIETL